MSELETKFHEFLVYLRTRNFAKASIDTRAGCLRFFLDYLRPKKIERLSMIGVYVLEGYIRHLHSYKTKSGQNLSVSRKNNLLITLNLFFEYLLDREEIFINPMEKIRLLKKEKTLPK